MRSKIRLEAPYARIPHPESVSQNSRNSGETAEEGGTFGPRPEAAR
jgi:hypothetical protein